ncbi:tyrosine recombinase XerC [Microbacterium sp. Se5.02b]|uniref:site-specific integrase n=1 Tax=Microbacterium sp. Se5.02b TaxID=2864103 RepID=UPI001C688777|nr:tyrosine-type recombinase/integrase [Microbacterium sp. Se5.02b]QYM63427.1 tyrosine-type recombinase/integrase [Microbacterium sp. Se5.02b]
MLGTWGKIKRAQRGGSWIAYARFRDYDGVTRQVERGGHTGAAAERALLAALRDRARLPNEDLTPETRLNRVIDDWDKHLDDRDLSDGSRVTYRRQLRHVRKAMGSLQLREVTVQAVDRFLTALQASSGPETARITRVVLSGVCQRAVRKGAMATNPVRDADTIPRKKPVVETLDVEAVGIVRSQLRAWDAGRDARGRARVTDLADPVDMIVGTGIRTGELFAVRWEDLELDLDVPLVHVTGTAVHKPKVGLVRQPYPKTEESNRSLRLPQFVVEMLLRRRVESTSEYVFDSTAGTLRSPNNFRTQWRTFRAASGYEDWVVPKTFRKAVATLVATVAGDDVAGDQLGHVKGSTVTRKNYIKRLHLGPDVREILEQFATDPALTQRIEK